MKLYLPIKPKFINQKFGETANLAYYKANGISFIGHNGIDFHAIHGQPIYASHSGICYPEIDNKGGNGVVIVSDDTFIYENIECHYKTIYWHMIDCDAVVGYGEHVNVGDLIGFADSTGLSTGDHLHFGFKPIALGEPPELWYNVSQNNGYMGAVDPMPYLTNEFAEDLPVKYQFKDSILIGDDSKDVVYLQRLLKRIGFFNANVTGYYGSITKQAVWDFQKKYVAIDWSSKLEVAIVKGAAVRRLTRAALNQFSA